MMVLGGVAVSYERSAPVFAVFYERGAPVGGDFAGCGRVRRPGDHTNPNP